MEEAQFFRAKRAYALQLPKSNEKSSGQRRGVSVRCAQSSSLFFEKAARKRVSNAREVRKELGKLESLGIITLSDFRTMRRDIQFESSVVKFLDWHVESIEKKKTVLHAIYVAFLSMHELRSRPRAGRVAWAWACGDCSGRGVEAHGLHPAVVRYDGPGSTRQRKLMEWLRCRWTR